MSLLALGLLLAGAAGAAPLDAVRAEVDAGRYVRAHEVAREWYRKAPTEPGLEELLKRLEAVAAVEAEAPEKPDKADRIEARAVRAFVQGRDRPAVLLASYALSIAPTRARVRRIADRLEALTDVRQELSPRGRTLWQDKHARAEEDYRSADYAAAAEDCADALLLEPDDVLAAERLGTNLFMQARFDDAIEAWKKALLLERTTQGKAAVESYIEKAASAKVGRTAEGVEQRTVPTPASLAPPATPSSGDIEALRQLGLDYRVRGDLAAAAQTFERVLRLDPDNAAARKDLLLVRRRHP